ncbi:hypothetical protein [Bradyrhizobium sp. TM239]|uniref:hypothetical protein n=1 Tax=Bradyrhizobium sp. TM239 TaxID=2599802 RepID=UPI0030C710D8
MSKMIRFTLICFVVLHFAYFACQLVTDDISLKIVDYIYLSIALGSLGAFLDVQSAALRFDTFDYMPQHVAKLEELYRNCPNNPAVHDTLPGCQWQGETLGYMRSGGYVHAVIKHKLDNYENNKAELARLHGVFFNEVASAYQAMDEAYKRFGVNPNEWEQLSWKLYFVYLFAIGAVMRIGKVSAELFDWKAKALSIVEAS